MRWFWIDRYTEFISGERATAVKNVSLAEEQIHDHFPGEPIMPNSLILEGIAQTGGLLVKEHGKFLERVILAKVTKAIFHRKAAPGDTLIYNTVIEQINKEGAMITATSHCNDELQAEVDIVFAHLDERSEGKELFEPLDLLTWLRILRVFEVGRNPDGTPVVPPDHLLAADLKTDQLH
ncbi:MAG: beta-hydroxyacyl-ACP dehydratase [Planctomycetales bacterium]|nr:beta-hydroxyacyl-ACP dehydratase [Planctomycetales bacterium]